MKLRALLAVIAIAATGTAFAATQTTTTTTTRHQKVVKKVKKTKTPRHAAASRRHARRMGASAEQMSRSTAAPDTDLAARERQQRVDEAYEQWKSTHR